MSRASLIRRARKIIRDRETKASYKPMTCHVICGGSGPAPEGVGFVIRVQEVEKPHVVE